MIDVVASLQWAGADVVAAYQLPVSVEVPSGGHVADLRDMLPREKSRDQLAREAEQAERQEREALQRRAEEVSEAAIARAQREPAQLKALLAPAVTPEAPTEPTLDALMLAPVVTVQEVVIAKPSAAALDEDAILAATVLLFCRKT